MAKFVSERNISFMLYEMFNVEELTQYPLYQDHSKEIFDMVLQAALKLGKDVFRPSFAAVLLTFLSSLYAQVHCHV